MASRTIAVFCLCAQVLATPSDGDVTMANANRMLGEVHNQIHQVAKRFFKNKDISYSSSGSTSGGLGLEDETPPWRRTAEALSYCTFADGKCKPDSAWATAEMAKITNTNTKALATKGVACMKLATETLCLGGTDCKWDGTGCEFEMSEADSQVMMKELMPSKGCGWIGTMMDGSAMCAVLAPGATCTANKDCKENSKFKIKAAVRRLVNGSTALVSGGSGATCVADGKECETKDGLYNKKMCPESPDPSKISSTCEKTLEDGMKATPPVPCKDETPECQKKVMKAMIDCLGSKCAIAKTAMEDIFKCQDYTTDATCKAEGQCSWHKADGARRLASTASCQFNNDISHFIPAGCAWKGIFVTSAACEKLKTEATCTVKTCSWQTEKSCEESNQEGLSGMSVSTKSECKATDAAAMGAMAGSTSSPDMKIFARIGMQEETCSKLTTEALCKAETVPALPTSPEATAAEQASALVSGARLNVAGGFLLWLVALRWN